MTVPPGDPAAPQGMAERHSPGQMLKKERELRGLSVLQAAEDLNLDRKIVEAIEADNFLALGAPVFARGHLRKYAALLGVSADLIVDRYDALSGTPAPPVVTTTTTAHQPRRKKRLILLPVLLVVLVMVAGIWWWLARGDSGTAIPAEGVPTAGSQAVGVVATPLSSPIPTAAPGAVPAAPVPAAPPGKSK